MNKKTAQIIFFILIILSVFAVAYVIYDFININEAIVLKERIIPFDSGVYYFLLMSVFWILGFIQYVGLKNPESKVFKYANFVLVLWFVLMLFLANLIPFYLTNKFETAGYIKCDDKSESSRVAKGESVFYKIGSC